jgi:citronellol/citronellal dehydrogenase
VTSVTRRPPDPSRSMFAPDLMRDRRCVVTGGGTGIGFSVAELLVRFGARVCLLGRREEVVKDAAGRLGAGKAVAHVCDIREPAQVEAAVAFAKRELDGIDVLINNAGGQFPAPAEAISPNGFQAVVRNNLLGTWNITREVGVSAMIEGGGGSIVNVIANVERGFPGMAHTGAARAGVDNLTKSLSVEWVRHGIRVNAVAPGYIHTEAMGNYPEDIQQRARRANPMMRFGTALEVAQAVLFLASDAASYVTGETLYVDGGARLWGDVWQIEDPAAPVAGA